MTVYPGRLRTRLILVSCVVFFLPTGRYVRRGAGVGYGCAPLSCIRSTPVIIISRLPIQKSPQVWNKERILYIGEC